MVKFFYDQKWLDKLMGFRGFITWAGVYIILMYWPKDYVPIWLVRHEMKHVDQHKHYGVLLFWLLYLIEWLDKFFQCGDWEEAYWNNYFEVEARKAEQV